MRVLIIGSGAREHALAWKLSQSSQISDLLVSPGNGGTAQVARNLPIGEGDISSLLTLARREAVDLTVVGPEGPIAAGLADRFHEAGLTVFAPSRRAARLESSKVWAKAFLARNSIPTAPFYVSSKYDDAVALVKMMPTPVVVKASGLAAGKGVAIAYSVREAEEILRRYMVDRALDAAGGEVVLEAFLEGREVSLLAFVDEHTAVPMPMACDYKRLEDGNRGPNTGGMGAYSPPVWLDDAAHQQIMDKVFIPTIEALRREQVVFRGVLYFGLMVTSDGPWVLEFNVRFGDPETQVIIPKMRSDLAEVLLATAQGRLGETRIDWDESVTCGVVVAAKGYPHLKADGVAFEPIQADDVQIFHAGTAPSSNGRWIATGGRLFTVVGQADTLESARARVYDVLGRSDMRQFHYRQDVGAMGATHGA